MVQAIPVTGPTFTELIKRALNAVIAPAALMVAPIPDVGPTLIPFCAVRVPVISKSLKL